MLYYIIPLLIFYSGVAVSIRFGGTSKAVLISSAIPLVLIVVLRGHSGTDTAAYFAAFKSMDSHWEYGGEPLFRALAETLWFIDSDPRFVVNTISFLTAMLTIWSIARTKYGAWFGGLLFVPALYYELTMNLLRFGLATSIFLLATAVPVERKPLRYGIFAILGTSMHFSSALLFVLFAAVTTPGRVKLKLFLALVIAAASLVMPDYLAGKSDLYSAVVAPNSSSGLLFLALQLALLGLLAIFRNDFNVPRVGYGLCVAMSFAFYGLTQITYAGIRFQLVLFVLLIVLLMRRYAPRRHVPSAKLTICLLFVGLLAFAGRAHNMLDEEGKGRSPFLPYQPLPVFEQYN